MAGANPNGNTVLHTRQRRTRFVKDQEYEPPNSLIAKAVNNLAAGLRGLALRLDDFRYPVDEYQQNTLSEQVTVVEVTPTYEYMAERITAIVVTGPAGAFTLQVGDRNWSLTMPASGVLNIGPLSLLLNRSDRRVLSSSTPGNWTFELMGWGDERY